MLSHDKDVNFKGNKFPNNILSCSFSPQFRYNNRVSSVVIRNVGFVFTRKRKR